jgi:hypothetical protein
MRHRFVLPAVCLVAAAAFFGSTAAARADNCAGAMYQVEISANDATNGFWIWAELDPGGQSGDYQETDCIHLGRGGPNGALHDAGDVAGWSVGGGWLTMTGVKILGGAETATVQVATPSSGMYGHTNEVRITITDATVPIVPVGATLVFSGHATQVQLAP